MVDLVLEVEWKEDYLCRESGEVLFEKGKRYQVKDYSRDEHFVICMEGEKGLPTLGHCRMLKQWSDGLIVYGKGVKRIGKDVKN